MDQNEFWFMSSNIKFFKQKLILPVMIRYAVQILILMMFWVPSFSQGNNKIIRMKAIQDFHVLTREGMASNRRSYAPFHIEEDLNALAGDDLNFTFHMAAAEGAFPGKSGKYAVSLNTLTERDGECVYNVYVNDERVGLFQQNPPTNEFVAPASLQWTGIEIPSNARIRVESNNWSNLNRHEDNFYEYARGRWTGVDFIPEEKVDNASGTGLNIGIFEKIENVGSAEIHTQASFKSVEQAYYLTVDRENTGINSENYGFLWKTVNGDFALETLVTPIVFADNKELEAGLMIRQSPAPGAPYVACTIQGNGQVFLRYGNVPGTATKEIPFTVMNAEMIQLEKKGNIFTMSAAKFGEEYVRKSIELPGFTEVQKVGFYISPGQANEREIVRFSRVRFFEDITANIEH
jgi:hypothetical protein